MNLNRNVKLTQFSMKNERRRKRLLQCSALILIVIGVVFQQIGNYTSASKVGRVGRLIDVDGTMMHLYESGSSEIPLVFTADIGSNVPYVDTYLLQNALAGNHQTLVYDKPGYGWSDYTSKPRDIDTICKEINTLLHAGEDPEDEDTFLKPFVYVAYGMGSLEAIRYAQLYPEDVAGIVLIEGASPSFCKAFNNIMIIESYLVNGLRNLGLLRLFGGTDLVTNTLAIHKDYPEVLQQLNKGLALEKTWNRNVISEKLNVPKNAEVILEDDTLGDIPIRVITSEDNVYSNWPRTQRSLLQFSTDTSQTFIEGSTEYIEPDAVPTILEVIEELLLHIEEIRDNY